MKIKDIIKKSLGLKKSDLLGFSRVKKHFDVKYGHFFYRRKYGIDDIINVLVKMGVHKGSNVFIHSGWDSFYNFDGSVKDFIDAVINLIGPEGTLAMPAIPLKRKKTFDVRKTVTSAGIIPETFRRYPGVKRSINVRHSVCALGPLAEEITSSHHMSLIRFDENSPYYKICELNFKVISIGLPAYFIGTIMHCVEATMWKEIPYFKDFYDFDNLIEQHYIGHDGVSGSYLEAKDRGGVRALFLRTQYILRRYFDKSYRSKAKLSNLEISCVDAQYTYNRLCELARNGIVLYVKPKFHN